MVFFGENCLAPIALCKSRLRKLWIDSDALIEHKTLAIKMCPIALFKILEDAAIELEDVLKTLSLQIGCSLFAANAAGAISDDRFLLELIRK